MIIGRNIKKSFEDGAKVLKISVLRWKTGTSMGW